MNDELLQREYFFDSIRAWLMLLGIPFHISLIYSSHIWHINSAEPSWWLTLLNDFIHTFRMPVFFVISGYFSYMLFRRYSLKRWWQVRIERVGIPMLTAIPLLTFPQFMLLHYVTGSNANWHNLSAYEKFNTLVWELISHLWFLLVLVVLTTISIWLFKIIQRHLEQPHKHYLNEVTFSKLSFAFLLLGLSYGALHRLIYILYPPILDDGLFTFLLMDPAFYIHFFLLGALAFVNPQIKTLFTTPCRWTAPASALLFIAYELNQQYASAGPLQTEIEAVLTMMMGLWMVNVVFTLGQRLLNFHSASISYLVNASLFIYLVHHPLTLLFGAWIEPDISSNTLGFFTGLVFVIGSALLLYEIHLRIPLLRFLFSGKLQNKHG